MVNHRYMRSMPQCFEPSNSQLRSTTVHQLDYHCCQLFTCVHNKYLCCTFCMYMTWLGHYSFNYFSHKIQNPKHTFHYKTCYVTHFTILEAMQKGLRDKLITPKRMLYGATLFSHEKVSRTYLPYRPKAPDNLCFVLILKKSMWVRDEGIAGRHSFGVASELFMCEKNEYCTELTGIMTIYNNI